MKGFLNYLNSDEFMGKSLLTLTVVFGISTFVQIIFNILN